ncbi:kinesin-like protein KIN-14S isoform X1 [Amborella trichopoda]|uniref:Kinesin motor domain-containing protein n=2 Tax=Amborella trichopoda TaxID=13333 RepID=W1PRP4_AMBTC|nr:kinesin-like protein KIN-14S isoform X1 [Amborella trichopoda]ERN12672.1 hypothetical protein AMTR_s00025p00245000 [Amborella trichopoda]|eukprot:XP_006851091.1 kinesin-like protein KIN-14S isoform X1 [Amborella trichopoda]
MEEHQDQNSANTSTNNPNPANTSTNNPKPVDEIIPSNGPIKIEDQALEAKSDRIKIPLSCKVDVLSSKLQILKKQHMDLSEDAKSITLYFPGIEIFSAFRDLEVRYDLIKKKYMEESIERKRLYNQVIELKGNIRVFCRCRPLNSEEKSSGSPLIVDFDPSQDSELHIVSSDSSRKQFRFDHVFGPHDTQEAVFTQTKPIVISVLDGYNVCIFAYGQTGTGKTFTMEGTPEDRGVNYRTLEELFHISRERKATMKYDLSVSMLEVYNERIRDLLVENGDASKKLEIKQGEGAQQIPGLVEKGVNDTEEVWEILKAGGEARAVGSTNANEFSSRSHCLVRVSVRSENLVGGEVTKSYLWLVDLAGSERLGKTDVQGERLKESQCINKSLSALGDVISALASKSSHVPYRNSKLTHLLQSSLGGDSKTLMFVQISPTAADMGETLCSLNFATRVRGIETGPARKQSDPIEFFKYKQMAEKLRHDEKETRKMQESLESLQLKFRAREQLCRNLQDKVRELESQLTDERKTRLLQENRASSMAATKSSMEKPPLFPVKRPPLSKLITNIPPPQSKPLIPPKTQAVQKENISPITNIPGMRARRVSISTASSSVIRPLTNKRRRVSFAEAIPSMTQFKMHQEDGKSYLRTSMEKSRLSLSRNRRRISRIFPPSAMKAAAMTPDRKFSNKFSSSPSSRIQVPWEPNLLTVSSPRVHRLLSPVNLRNLKNSHALNKFCSSLNKKVVTTTALSSPSTTQHKMGIGGITGKFGSAQRVLCNNVRRRASIQPITR